jgi:hypothetical protein
MIEAKQKDAELFQLEKDLKELEGVTWIDRSGFIIE